VHDFDRLQGNSFFVELLVLVTKKNAFRVCCDACNALIECC
jgi:hypothetical protein